MDRNNHLYQVYSFHRSLALSWHCWVVWQPLLACADWASVVSPSYLWDSALSLAWVWPFTCAWVYSAPGLHYGSSSSTSSLYLSELCLYLGCSFLSYFLWGNLTKIFSELLYSICVFACSEILQLYKYYALINVLLLQILVSLLYSFRKTSYYKNQPCVSSHYHLRIFYCHQSQYNIFYLW